MNRKLNNFLKKKHREALASLYKAEDKFNHEMIGRAQGQLDLLDEVIRFNKEKLT